MEKAESNKNEMTLSQSFLSAGLGLDFIDRIEDKSDPALRMTRMRIYFKNGRELSIIRGEYSYGGPEGLFEIMPCGNDGDGDLLDEADQGDSVCGYLSEERVKYYVHKIGAMKT